MNIFLNKLSGFYFSFILLLSISFLSFINGSEKTNSTAVSDSADCDPNIIYFKQDVLPLLQSNCAKSGCHNEESQKHGVILTSYENLIRTVEIEDDDDDRFDDRNDDDRGRNKNRDNDRLKNFLRANGSQGDRYKNKLEKMLRRNKMPPSPNKKLTQEQKDIIYKWIDQGMQNNSCEISASDCMSENMSFESDIRPIIEENCVGCHSGAKPKMGYDFSNSEKFREVALTGDVYLAITHSEGVTAMPFEGDKLSDCDIKKIKSWIDDGAVLK